jgi:hypothetical protein
MECMKKEASLLALKELIDTLLSEQSLKGLDKREELPEEVPEEEELLAEEDEGSEEESPLEEKKPISISLTRLGVMGPKAKRFGRG